MIASLCLKSAVDSYFMLVLAGPAVMGPVGTFAFWAPGVIEVTAVWAIIAYTMIVLVTAVIALDVVFVEVWRCVNDICKATFIEWRLRFA